MDVYRRIFNQYQLGTLSETDNRLAQVMLNTEKYIDRMRMDVLNKWGEAYGYKFRRTKDGFEILADGEWQPFGYVGEFQDALDAWEVFNGSILEMVGGVPEEMLDK